MIPSFEIDNLSFCYPGGEEAALEGVSLTVERGAFLVLCGPSGSGKSTLLRQLKPDLAPHGSRTGSILFEGAPLDSLDRRAQCQKIGFVLQSPEDQLVTDKVWHELAFGLESLGYDSAFIRRRVAETAAFFGIQPWFRRAVSTLSGGQKQLLNLASVMAADPSVLILDEPTAQLDPVAAADLLGALSRLNRELGVTVILSEQRLEDALPLASSAAVLDRGRLLCAGAPAEVGQRLKDEGRSMFLSMPASMRIWAGTDAPPPCPVTVREGREWLGGFAARRPLGELPPVPERSYPGGDSFRAKGLWFRYKKDGPEAVSDFSLSGKRGELLALLGGNGAGKTTVLKLLAGLCRPLRGKVERSGKAVLLPQDPETLFTGKTVREDLLEVAPAERLEQAVSLCRLEGLLDRHPFDLSGGERQRAALAKVLLADPDILLLDEPTKGLDGAFKAALGDLLEELCRQGKTVLFASHDLEFCARYAHRCALLFDGSIAAEGPPREFFSGGGFYTTAANRVAREQLPQAVTVEDVIAACGGSPPSPPEPGPPPTQPIPPKPASRPREPGGPPKKRRLSRSSLVSILCLLLAAPLTVLAGKYLLPARQATLVSLLVLLECMAPFFLAFEGRRPQAKELVLVAALCALAVAGRAAFSLLPQCKPVLALTILAGAALGGEAGFLVGAVSMLVSNLFFGQGPWTPWQMFAMGLCGFFAGLLFRRGRLPKNRWLLALYGALAAVALYGGIMNLSSALTWNGQLEPGVLLAFFASGFPFDCVHGGATFLFLWLGGPPVLEKLERVREKYGLLGA